jgi:hypothetical protein
VYTQTVRQPDITLSITLVLCNNRILLEFSQGLAKRKNSEESSVEDCMRVGIGTAQSSLRHLRSMVNLQLVTMKTDDEYKHLVSKARFGSGRGIDNILIERFLQNMKTSGVRF